jgi:hypothetical protein
MTESKIETTVRLQRDGRWPEASKWKDAKIKELRTQGMSRAEAQEEAWRLLAIEYPHLPSAAEPEHSDDVGDVEGKAAMLLGSSPLPAAWGELPDSAPFDAEVEWVHQNRVLVVEERSSGKSLLHWERARKPAPSYGAVNLMEFAATNRKGFMDILQRVKPGSSGEDQQIVREKQSVADIRKMIQERMEGEAEKLAANVPEAIKAKVNVELKDWERKFALTISEDAKTGLEARLAVLVQECMDTIAMIAAKQD